MTGVQPTADCYSGGERRAMEATQRWRAAALAPLLPRLTAWRVGPDGVTVASLAAGLSFAALWPDRPWLAVLMLLAHAVLDGIDGPLARHQRRAGAAGSLTDTLSDQCVLAGVVAALMASGWLGAWNGGLFLFIYTVVVAFAMVRNALSIPYSWLIRPRFVLYAALPLQLTWGVSVVPWLTGALSLVLGAKLLSGYAALRTRLRRAAE
ncbi:MAG: CDP-alcohol phosphatidyltransferase family protein [Planctomyces sp.]|nr:CDP-alcohol phosphatidyltransferase family protein [Planctomyces sp.]